MKKSLLLAWCLTLGAGCLTAGPAAAQQPAASAAANGAATGQALKVIRYAFLIAETGFDPPQITDLYSRTVASGIFDAPYEFEFLAKPARMRPNTAAGMPEMSADFKTITFRIKPGIYFADDPAFKGKKRELTAEDYVYSLKRHYDPRWKSGNLYILENAKILGLSELRKRLIEEKKPFDYDTPVEGLKALDRYTVQIKLGEPAPRLISSNFTDGSFTGAVAREVVEMYGDKITEHPVGTGPFKLAAWKRSSRIVLARNPGYREVFYDERPSDAPGEYNDRLRSLASKLKGQRLPMIDEVHISIIEEPQPRFLSFLNEEHDVLDQLPAEFATSAIPNNRLAPNLAKKGLQMVRYPRADVSVSYFGMEHPVVGGYEPHKVALRRAINLAVDVDREIRLVRRGQAIPAQGPIAPETTSYDPTFKTEMSDFSRGRAKALLDLHGWVDKDGDGWRD
ncbi:MAG: bicyclomycin resistance protein, partial [Chitinophagaceae bacterium]|nr:bicyclomycin resistance protein [Rubrivivax sp.]